MANWTVGAARNLPIVRRASWDGAAARERLFGDGEEIDRDRARRGHLIYDAEAPELKGSYKLPFADVEDGQLVAVDAGLRAAAGRLPQTDAPQDVLERARGVLDGYFRRMEEGLVANLRRHFGLLQEAVDVSQSYEELTARLSYALNNWPGRPAEQLVVAFTFSDRLIAFALPSAESQREGEPRVWEIPWREEGDSFVFGEPVAVRRVVRFEPVAESLTRRGVRISESVEQALMVLGEAKGGGRRVRAIGVTADVVNANGRRYPRAVLAAAIADLNSHLHESAGQGRLILTGEAEHPSHKPTRRPHILETVVKWEQAALDVSGRVILEGVILPTAKGRDILVLVENGVPIGVSQRGYGLSELVEEDGQTIEEVRELRITGYDLVAEPSDPYARILESKEPAQEPEEGETPMDKQDTKVMKPGELMALLEEHPELREALMKEFSAARREALAESLGVEPENLEGAVKEALAAKAELEERKRREAVEAAIAEATKGLAYGEKLNSLFVEAVRAAGPQKPEDVPAIVEAKRKEWDGILSAAKLARMGKGDVQVLGPVFERETGQPNYVRAAVEINESLVRAGQGHRRDLSKAQFGAELFAARYLDLFDRQYRRELIAEARQFEEAETTADLNLPYSVMRTIVQQAFPELVAANVFDFGTTDQSPARLYFEQYEGESGSTASVTDEAVTANLNAWVNLVGARLKPGTVVVTNNVGSTTYTEGTDYVVDYGKGRLMALSGGSISDGQALLVDYSYDAVRKGEMQPIERAKQVLSHKLLEIAADRLATQISSEAIVFSRSQLGYDAVTRTLAGLVQQIRIKIDRDIFYLALAASLQQPNNSGGTWNSGTDSLDKLVEYIGHAKVKVYNRYYTPTAIVMSRANADLLSNWSGFKRDGFPDAVLNAAGFAGSVKGLPIWSTTEFSDGYILIPNRELVMHRVFQPMQLKGPFPSYDSTGKIIAADQYYVEEYNGTDVPVVEKVAHVVVA
ncbi:hypothetical protein [Caldilinea sp.]|uniref:phage tail tube protein n=1 Tax=Caldilinea sp. TaxID=2293560 RepID=UPI0021DBB1B7|nr:hypothetical protein [Caldilinea sp.]GIV73548.1 MAG: hypothetical protein KatS3mg049_2104 [Caldilinea sp.]